MLPSASTDADSPLLPMPIPCSKVIFFVARSATSLRRYLASPTPLEISLVLFDMVVSFINSLFTLSVIRLVNDASTSSDMVTSYLAIPPFSTVIFSEDMKMLSSIPRSSSLNINFLPSLSSSAISGFLASIMSSMCGVVLYVVLSFSSNQAFPFASNLCCAARIYTCGIVM